MPRGKPQKQAPKQGPYPGKGGTEWILPLLPLPSDATDDQRQEAINRMAEIPGLRVNEQDWLAVGSVDAVAAAAVKLGFPAPETYDDNVDPSELPKKLPLRHYQQDGVCRMVYLMRKYGGALLADDMGLGKTRQAVAAARTLTDHDNGRTFIVCPASVRETWREELVKCGVDPIHIAILGPPSNSKFKSAWRKAAECRWVVTSYDLAARAEAEAFGESAQDVLILDEAHGVKGRKAKRAQAIQDIGAMSRYRLLLTGTPIWSYPRDLWRILRILLGGRFGNSFAFDMRYCDARAGEHGGYDNKGASHTDELKLRLGYYMLRRLKADVLTELPPLTRQVLWIDPTREGLIAFQAAHLKSGSGSIQNALHATLLGKVDVSVQLAHDAKRFLLFTYRRVDARSIAKRIAEEGTPCYAITGEDTVEVRNGIAKQAAAEGAGIVATIDSLSVGVNLQAIGSIGIMHALDHVPLKMLQGEARLHRMGQLNPVTWYYLAMKDTMDEVIVHSIVNKLEQWKQVMGKDDAALLRDSLNAAVGVGAEDDKAVLKAIYDQMAHMEEDDGE